MRSSTGIPAEGLVGTSTSSSMHCRLWLASRHDLSRCCPREAFSVSASHWARLLVRCWEESLRLLILGNSLAFCPMLRFRLYLPTMKQVIEPIVMGRMSLSPPLRHTAHEGSIESRVHWGVAAQDHVRTPCRWNILKREAWLEFREGRGGCGSRTPC